MKKPSKINIKPKILIFVLTLLCIGSLILSVVAPSFSNPIKTVAGTVVIPLQDGDLPLPESPRIRIPMPSMLLPEARMILTEQRLLHRERRQHPLPARQQHRRPGLTPQQNCTH